MPRSVTLAIALIFAAPARGAEPIDAVPDYPHKSLVAQSFGAGAKSYWLFEPAGPTPEKAPVVVFHHGWLAVNPGVYGAWIEHLCRSGRIVVFPRYQGDITTKPADFLPNAVAAVRDALDVLETAPGRVRPDRSRFALIGHSAGGNLAAEMAAVSSKVGLPEPRAVVAIFPGEVKPLFEPDFAEIPPETLLVIAAGSEDWIVGDGRAREIYAKATAIPPDRKEFVLFRSDRSGPISVIADHLAPTAGLATLDSGEGLFRARQMSHATLDLLDRHGFWRMADLTIDAGFAGLTLDEATDGGAHFRDLGRWGDGRAVTPPISGDDLAAIPRVIPTHGVSVFPWSTESLRRLVVVQKP